MTLGFKLWKAALNSAFDIILKEIKKSPERCSRNLIELGVSAIPDWMSENEKDNIQKLLNLCKAKDISAIKELFFASFK